MEEAPPLEELDVLEAVDSKGEASYSYAAISTYSQTGSYPPDAEKQEKRGLRKRAKYFVVRWQTTLCRQQQENQQESEQDLTVTAYIAVWCVLYHFQVDHIRKWYHRLLKHNRMNR